MNPRSVVTIAVRLLFQIGKVPPSCQAMGESMFLLGY